jgi:hypothetical protein
MASTRRLAAILAADIAGYSRLTGADEEGTHEWLDGWPMRSPVNASSPPSRMSAHDSGASVVRYTFCMRLSLSTLCRFRQRTDNSLSDIPHRARDGEDHGFSPNQGNVKGTMFRRVSAGLRKLGHGLSGDSEAVALRHPIMPVADGLGGGFMGSRGIS